LGQISQAKPSVAKSNCTTDNDIRLSNEKAEITMWHVAVLILLPIGTGVGAGPHTNPDDSWSGWRSRQRTELATLPKPPEPPQGNGSHIDRFTAADWAKAKFTPPPLIDDATFARRVYLDVVGFLPTVEQLDQFINDKNPEKRKRLVEALLADQQGYAEHWMTFWNDLVRNDEQTNIDGLRKPITGWLYQSLLENKAIDLMVAELLNPGSDGPDGYLKGVNWRGRVNASQTPPVQAAQNVSQVFLASSIKCASCHNSFINHWKLAESYGMASFFSPQNLEMHRCDKPTGKMVPAKFLFEGLGEVPSDADLAARHRAVAQMVTRPKNPRFAKAMVNRFWKRLMGRGLSEPVDDFDDHQPDSVILEWLAYDFISHDYDAKNTLRIILLSKVYQLPAVENQMSKAKEMPPLRGPVERRLTSEQFLDGMAQVTSYWPKNEVMNVKVDNPHVREWRHRKPTALAIALGRPNREQVCTVRNEESTVLQSLELVNGKTMAERLSEGAKTLLASDLGKERDSTKVTATLYRRALSRMPTEAETSLARTLLGSPEDKPLARQDGWEDFLWALVISPEFQFVR
jgi:hypothetical protein